MTVQEEMAMRDRIKSRLEKMDASERFRLKLLMGEAAKLSAILAERIASARRFAISPLNSRLERLFLKAESRYQRRAVAYYGE